MPGQVAASVIANGPQAKHHDHPISSHQKAMPYRFRHNESKGCRYSLWASRFETSAGVISVLQWFRTAEEQTAARAEMEADPRFSGIASYVRSQEIADCY